MKKLFTLLCLLSTCGLFAQVDFNSKDFITPYDGVFRPGTNLGYYPGWSTKQLGNLAGGNPDLGVLGIGAKTLRPVLSESVLEVFGYDVVVDDFETIVDRLDVSWFVELDNTLSKQLQQHLVEPHHLCHYAVILLHKLFDGAIVIGAVVAKRRG